MNHQRLDIPTFDPSLNGFTQSPNPFGNGAGGDDGSRRLGMPPPSSWTSIPPISPYSQNPFTIPQPSPQSSIPPVSPYSHNHFSNDSSYGGMRAGIPSPSPQSSLPPVSPYSRNTFGNGGGDGGRRAEMPPPSPQSSLPPVSPYSRNTFGNDGSDGGWRDGMHAPSLRSSIPPVPPYSHNPTTNQTIRSHYFSPGPRLSRSLSLYSFDSQLPLSHSASWLCHSPPAPVEDTQNRDRGWFQCPSSPPRTAHKRVSSDIPLRFGLNVMTTQNSPELIYPKPIELSVGDMTSGLKEGFGEQKVEEEAMDDLLSAFVNLDSSDSASETKARKRGNKKLLGKCTLGVKRRAGKGIAAPSGILLRSVSVDRCLDKKSSILPGEESPKLPPSPTSFEDGSKFVFSHNDKLTRSEMRKIADRYKLLEMAESGPKRVTRILKNKYAAKRSKEKKAQYVSDLENQVQTLQADNARLSSELTSANTDNAALMAQTKEQTFRIRLMEQHAELMEKHAKLRNAFIQQLTGDVQRLKALAGEASQYLSESDSANTQPLNTEMYQQPNINQLHEHQRQTPVPNEQIYGS